MGEKISGSRPQHADQGQPSHMALNKRIFYNILKIPFVVILKTYLSPTIGRFLADKTKKPKFQAVSYPYP